MAVEYLTLADGRRISTSTGLDVSNIATDSGAAAGNNCAVNGNPVEVEPETADRARIAPPRGVLADREPDFVTPRARTIADLPEEGKRSNIVALAVSLQLFGLNDDEIAMQMRADVDAVRGLLLSQSASTVRDAIVDSVSRRYEPKVRAILNEASIDAAKEVVSAIQRGSPGNRLRAASSVLDRTGHAAVNNVEHRVNGGLVIEVIQRTSAVPDIVVDGI